MKKALNWQLHHPKHKLYDWTNGAFYTGVFAAYETLDSKNIYKAIYAMGESNKWEPGPRLHHADDHVICQTYIDLYRISNEKKMIQPFIETMDEFMATPYETEGFRKCTWWWCDALFMAPTALVKLGINNTIRYIEEVFRILKTDLSIRPIFHKKDENTIAHLFLGIMAYSIVNTVRYRLKNMEYTTTGAI